MGYSLGKRWDISSEKDGIPCPMIKCGDDQDGVTAMHDLAIVVQYVGRGPSWRCGSLMNAKALWKRKGDMISLWSISTRTLSSSVLAPSKS